jgi:hypothetical protein
MPDDDPRPRIAEAFDRLMPPAASAEEVKRVVALLVIMAQGQPPANVRPQSYRKVGTDTTFKELDRFLAGVREVLAASEAFHEGAILAFGERSVLRTSYEGILQWLATEGEAAKAHIKPQQPDRGRPRDDRAITVARIVMNAYEKIFDANANLPNQTPGLPGLVREIFAVLHIAANPRASLATALAERASSKPIQLPDPADV